LAQARIIARTRQAETTLDRLAPWIDSTDRVRTLQSNLDGLLAQKDAALSLVSIHASLSRYS
jgi:hypothetical protein